METNPYQSPQHVTEPVELADDSLVIAAKRRLRTPALLAIGLALLNALFDGVGMLYVIFSSRRFFGEDAWFWSGSVAPLLIGLCLFEAFCIWNLLTLRSLAWAEFGAILVALPFCSPFYIVGLPFGWWLVHLLGKPEIKQAFKHARHGDLPVDKFLS